MKMFAIAAAVVMTGSLTGMAHATTTAQNVQQQVVSYADLNLENAADAAILHKRIQSAARKVCGVYRSPIPLDFSSPLRACAADATARALAEVNAPLMSRNIVVRNFAE